MVPATVVVRVAERNRLTAQTGTYLQNGEGSMEASLASRNSLGYAEVLELQLTRGHERSNAFRLNLSKPRPLGLGCTAQLGARKLLASRERIASHSEKTQAADATVAWGSPAGRLGSHSLTYELALREATKLTPAASAAVHACARSSLKSALRYTLLLDRRDHPLTPSSGGALRLVSELAGVSGVGDERWLKQTAEASAHVTLWERVGLVAGLSLVVGAIVPFGGPAPPPPAAPAGPRPAGWAGGAPASRPPGAFLTDRFLLGGVSSVRGFRTHAIGPRAERRLLSPDELAVYADAARRAATRATFDVGGFGGSALARMEGHDESVGPPALPRGRFDALGGEVSAHVLGTLSCALPAPLAAYGVRAHVFANGGSLDEWEAFNQSGQTDAQRDTTRTRGCEGSGARKRAQEGAWGRDACELRCSHARAANASASRSSRRCERARAHPRIRVWRARVGRLRPRGAHAGRAAGAQRVQGAAQGRERLGVEAAAARPLLQLPLSLSAPPGRTPRRFDPLRGIVRNLSPATHRFMPVCSREW
jgi:outer membrane protein assembly factor BamA